MSALLPVFLLLCFCSANAGEPMGCSCTGKQSVLWKQEAFNNAKCSGPQIGEASVYMLNSTGGKTPFKATCNQIPKSAGCTCASFGKWLGGGTDILHVDKCEYLGGDIYQKITCTEIPDDSMGCSCTGKQSVTMKVESFNNADCSGTPQSQTQSVNANGVEMRSSESSKTANLPCSKVPKKAGCTCASFNKNYFQKPLNKCIANGADHSIKLVCTEVQGVDNSMGCTCTGKQSATLKVKSFNNADCSGTPQWQSQSVNANGVEMRSSESSKTSKLPCSEVPKKFGCICASFNKNYLQQPLNKCIANGADHSMKFECTEVQDVVVVNGRRNLRR